MHVRLVVEEKGGDRCLYICRIKPVVDHNTVVVDNRLKIPYLDEIKKNIRELGELT
jgi:hypothetical protein